MMSNTIPNGTLLDFLTTSCTLLPKFTKKTLSILTPGVLIVWHFLFDLAEIFKADWSTEWGEVA